MNQSKTTNPPIKTINGQEYDQLMQGAVPDSTHHNPSRLSTLPDGRLAKVFEPGSIFSTDWWRPSASRFIVGANELKRRGVHCVDVVERYRLSNPKRDIIIYEPLEGIDLRQAMHESGEIEKLYDRFVYFLAELHDKGIFFRGLHFGNIIAMPGDRLGLVDIVSIRFFNRPLSLAMRVRNFRHVLKYRLDKDKMREYGLEKIVQTYLDHAKLDPAQARKLQAAVVRL